MAEPKTQMTRASVAAFLSTIADTQKRADCRTVAKIIRAATKATPKMWGTSIVGFGLKPITYADGHTVEWPLIGFSPRKQNIVLYVPGLKRHQALLDKLGAHKCSGGCLYIKRLSDVHVPTLERLVTASIRKA